MMNLQELVITWLEVEWSSDKLKYMREQGEQGEQGALQFQMCPWES